jgi:hypothetical protein
LTMNTAFSCRCSRLLRISSTARPTTKIPDVEKYLRKLRSPLPTPSNDSEGYGWTRWNHRDLLFRLPTPLFPFRSTSAIVVGHLS